MSRREESVVLPCVVLSGAPLSPSSTACSSAWHCRHPAPCVGAPSAQHAWLWWLGKLQELRAERKVTDCLRDFIYLSGMKAGVRLPARSCSLSHMDRRMMSK